MKNYKAAALLLTVACAVTGAACWVRPAKETQAETGQADLPPKSSPERGPFAGWDKPDFVLLLSAQQHGYLLPCGCSSPQYGGLERRYNLLQEMRKERGWDVLPLDLGDIPQIEAPAKLPNVQGVLKYTYAMEALAKMDYLAVSFGEYEATLGLGKLLDEYAMNNAKPAVLSANLLDRAKLFPHADRPSKTYVNARETATVRGGTKVSVLGITGSHDRDKEDDPKSVAEILKAKTSELQFERADRALPPALKEMDADGVRFRVLLYQGPMEKAQLLAKAFPAFNVILCLSASDLASMRPVLANDGDTFLVSAGHKGKNVVAVGVWRTGDTKKPFDMKYQTISLGEEYKTPDGKEAGNPIVALMERYTKDLKEDKYLAKYGQNAHLVQVEAQQIEKYKKEVANYVGSDACRKCHKHAYTVWKASDHAKAYPTLVNAKRPGNRQYDAECIVCHTVGFGYNTGFKDNASPEILKAVGCESCHGPSGLHVAHPDDAALQALLNPWKASPKKMLKIEALCQHCHDSDNDVHWTIDKWEQKNIVHMTP